MPNPIINRRVVFSPKKESETILMFDEFMSGSLDGAKWTVTNPSSGSGITYDVKEGFRWKCAHTSVSNIPVGTNYIESVDTFTNDLIVISFDLTVINRTNSTSQHELLFWGDSDNKIYIGNSNPTEDFFFRIKIGGVVTDTITLPTYNTRFKMVIDNVGQTASGYYWDNVSAWVLGATFDISGFATPCNKVVFSPQDISTESGGDKGVLNSIYVTDYDYAEFSPVSTDQDIWVTEYASRNPSVSSTILSKLDTYIKAERLAGRWNKRLTMSYFKTGVQASNLDYVKGAYFTRTQVGSVTHGATGVNGDGSTGYFNTGVVLATEVPIVTYGYSVYCVTNSSGTKTTRGASNGTTQRFQSFIRNLSDQASVQCWSATTDLLNSANTDSSGVYTMIRRSASDEEHYRNGTSLGSITASSGTRPTLANFFMAQNNVGTAINFDDKVYAMDEEYYDVISDSEASAISINITTLIS